MYAIYIELFPVCIYVCIALFVIYVNVCRMHTPCRDAYLFLFWEFISVYRSLYIRFSRLI